MNNCQQAVLGAIFLGWTTAPLLHADVKLPAIFGDHMVLQEDAKLPVWGTADPGEAVTVKIGAETAHATADASRHWRAELAPLAADGKPAVLTVTGKNTVTCNDVLVGDVWLCSGQSNMEFGIGKDSRGAATIAQANEPEIRLFLVPKVSILQPQADIGASKDPLPGKWQVCTPQTLGGNWGWRGFSAVGYYFGREIHQLTGKPVGLIGSYWGGTPAEAWTSLSGLKKEPALKHYVDAYEKTLAAYAAASAAYPARLAAYQTEFAAWEANGGKAFEDQMKTWATDANQAALAGTPPPPKPVPATPMPKTPPTPDGGPHGPANLYNGMIAPLLPFAIKGAIWYQGESNAGAAFEYRTLFRNMITDWRRKWGEGNFPFLFVQIASFNSGPVENWPFLREAQAMALSLPKTGMATAVDVGNPKDIHPTDKLDVGHRLALVAEHLVYGQKVDDSGPVYDAAKKKGGAIMLSFTQEDGGLVIGSAPWTPPGAAPLPADHLTGFTIAGPDKKWIAADAKIEGKTVVVSSPQVPKPAAVRYDWANVAGGNLYNQDGLPALPFRSDDWSDPVAMGLVPPATAVAPSSPVPAPVATTPAPAAK